MKQFFFSITVLSAAGLAGFVPAMAGSYGASDFTSTPAHKIILKVGERLGFPPPDPPGTVHPKLDAAVVQDAVNQQLKRRFDAAADSSGHLTPDAAKAGGWGFIADHFAEIDRYKQGYVSFSDVSAFMKARSPLKVPASSATSSDKTIQIIE